MSAVDEPQVLGWMFGRKSLALVGKRLGRIGVTVLPWLDRQGRRQPGGWVTVSQTVLADEAEATREGVCKHLSKQVALGIVDHETRLAPDGRQVVDRWRLNREGLRKWLNERTQAAREASQERLRKAVAAKAAYDERRRRFFEGLKASREAVMRAFGPRNIGCELSAQTFLEGSKSSEKGRLAAAMRSAMASGVGAYAAAQVVMRDHPGATLADLLDLVAQEGREGAH